MAREGIRKSSEYFQETLASSKIPDALIGSIEAILSCRTDREMTTLPLEAIAAFLPNSYGLTLSLRVSPGSYKIVSMIKEPNAPVVDVDIPTPEESLTYFVAKTKSSAVKYDAENNPIVSDWFSSDWAKPAPIFFSVPVFDSQREVRAVITCSMQSVELLDLDEVFYVELAAKAMSSAWDSMEQNAKVFERAMAVERDRLAQEIHDSVAQDLFYVDLHLRALSVDSSLSSDARDKLASISSAVASQKEELRRILGDLKSVIQDAALRLEDVIECEVARHYEKGGVEVGVSLPSCECPPLSTGAIELARLVLRESLSNVRKHAGASSVSVCIALASGMLHLSIEDDGVGVGHAARGESSFGDDGFHFGIDNLRRNVEGAGGSFYFGGNEEGNGKGALVWASIPLSERGHDGR